MSWLLRVLIALSQLVNSLLGGQPDETLSSRAYRCSALADRPLRRWHAARLAIDAAFFWEHEHCRESYAAEVRRKHFPTELQKKCCGAGRTAAEPIV